MRAKDSSNLNDIIKAAEEAVTNIKTTVEEQLQDIIITITLPKVGTIGRPRKDPLKAEQEADKVAEAQTASKEREQAGGND